MNAYRRRDYGVVGRVSLATAGLVLSLATVTGAENGGNAKTALPPTAAGPISAEQAVPIEEGTTSLPFPAPQLPPPEPVLPRFEADGKGVLLPSSHQQTGLQAFTGTALNQQPTGNQPVKTPQQLIQEREEQVTQERRAAIARRQAQPPIDPATHWADSALLQNPRIYEIDRGMSWTPVKVPFRMHRHLP